MYYNCISLLQTSHDVKVIYQSSVWDVVNNLHTRTGYTVTGASCANMDLIHAWINKIKNVMSFVQVVIQRSRPSMYSRLSIYRGIVFHDTAHSNFESKTSARLQTHKRYSYLALTGKLWTFLMSYVGGNDRGYRERTAPSFPCLFEPWKWLTLCLQM